MEVTADRVARSLGGLPAPIIVLSTLSCSLVRTTRGERSSLVCGRTCDGWTVGVGDFVALLEDSALLPSSSSLSRRVG